jgi:hypothetical protein
MITFKHSITYCVLSLALLPTVWGQRRHDPLSPQEIDDLRETAQMPEKRLVLYVKYARARLDSVEKAISDTKSTDRGQQIHNALQDFMDVYDELNDNIDTYSDQKYDLRKALKAIIEADTEFQARLRAVESSAAPSAEEKKTYLFLLSTALESIDNSVPDHRQLLGDQEEAAKHKKKEKNNEHSPGSGM